MTAPIARRPTWLLMCALCVVAACQKPDHEQQRSTIGHVVTRLGVQVGSIWESGYAVDVSPSKYAVVEHESCPNAKDESPVEAERKGLCVVRITREQSDRFQAAMEPYRGKAIPLYSYSVNDPDLRPDGKPCVSRVTDATMVTLIWSGTEGDQIASFYLGCDREEFAGFYEKLLSVTDALPIQEIVAARGER